MYAILECNMIRLEKKLNRIKNKCEKYGVDFHYEKVGEEFREIETGEVNLDTGKPITATAKFILVEAEGTALINDWEFIATVEHTEKGNLIQGYKKDIEVPERYYNSDPICEHCKSNRYRKNTYIVHNVKTDEFKQVGKSCLNDFTHGLSAEAIASYISMFDELIKGEYVDPSGGWTHYYDTKEMLQFMAECIRKFGYVKRDPYSSTPSTAERASAYRSAYYNEGGFIWEEINRKNREEMRRIEFDHNSPQAIKMTEDALAWIAEQEEFNNYMHNLKTACSLKYDDGKAFGLLASLFPTYDRSLEREAQKRLEEEKRARERANEANSKFIGEVGDRITIKNIHKIKLLTSWDTQWGYVYLWKIVDADGNVYIWRTSNGDLGKEDINAIRIIGTIKKHEEFNGIKQTQLTRCKVQHRKEKKDDSKAIA